MARTKRTLRILSPPHKRVKAIGVVKYACHSPPTSPSTSVRPTTGALSPKPSPDKAMHDALTPLLDQAALQSMANLGLGHQASHKTSRLWIQVIFTSLQFFFPSFCSILRGLPLFFPFEATSASRALGDGHTLMSQQTQDLHVELTRERLKLRALEQELQELRGQVSNYPWDLAWKYQELRRG
ncbi:hypothetical protein LIER_30972 [Lithospermum erythrorhizon]|uniref:Uncharacterized protein n=1 Tax=Lithospermum erythrorhizon TaxID=34254 RepID=A0AAV3RSZ6_LITER